MAKSEPDKPPPTRYLSPQTSNALRHIVAGGSTGGLSVMITYPTEYVKTVLQLDMMGKRKLNGTWDAYRSVVKEGSHLQLYRGFSLLFIGNIPKIAVRFFVFELLRENMEDERGRLSNFGKFFCGAGAGVAEAVLAVTPIETLKVKYINDAVRPNPQIKGIIHCIKLIVKEQGWRGIYRSPFTTTVKQGSNQSLRFFAMENMKDLYKGDDKNKKVPAVVTGIMGVIAGAFSTFGNNPVDVVKTHMQSLNSHKYKNSFDCAIKVIKHEGVRGFYRGLTPRLFRVCLDVGMTFMIYDQFMALFNKYWPVS